MDSYTRFADSAAINHTTVTLPCNFVFNCPLICYFVLTILSYSCFNLFDIPLNFNFFLYSSAHTYFCPYAAAATTELSVLFDFFLLTPEEVTPFRKEIGGKSICDPLSFILQHLGGVPPPLRWEPLA